MRWRKIFGRSHRDGGRKTKNFKCMAVNVGVDCQKLFLQNTGRFDGYGVSGRVSALLESAERIFQRISAARHSVYNGAVGGFRYSGLDGEYVRHPKPIYPDEVESDADAILFREAYVSYVVFRSAFCSADRNGILDGMVVYRKRGVRGRCGSEYISYVLHG